MLTNVRMALKALTQNKLQATLTLLGMSVGVAMVVIVSGLGRGAQLRIESQIESAGPTRITIRPGNFVPSAIDSRGEQDSGGGEPSEGAVATRFGADGSETPDVAQDAAASDARRRIQAVKRTQYRSPPTPLRSAELDLIAQTPDVRSAAGTIQGNASLDPGSTLPVATLHLAGFDPAWPEMTGWRLIEGRLPSASEHRDGAPVMLVSAATARQLWPNRPALDQTASLRGTAVRVVGVIDAAEDAEASTVVPPIHVPNAFAQAALGRDTYDSITVRTTSIGVTSTVAKALEDTIRAFHRLPDNMANDFRVETQSNSALPMMGSDPRLARAVHSNSKGFEQASWEEMAKSLRRAGRTFTYLLASAAAVSLLVGGIGVMNIMLVSVAARTREIGLRMALGARTRDVMVQFLVEAITLAALGGVIGLALGGVGLLVTKHGFHWATAVSPVMLLVALAMAAITGVAFGIGPARRAAQLDPVIALRSE
jgi:putative ABC transport system permease protein